MKTSKSAALQMAGCSQYRHALLPALIALALFSGNVQAQGNTACEELQGTPPGLYVTSDEGRVFVIKGDKLVELAPGDAAFANEDSLTCLKAPPELLEWPCSTDAAQSRKFATYAAADLQTGNPVKEIVQRYFEIPEVMEPVPNWLEGEANMSLASGDIISFSSPEYWYLKDPSVDILNEKRPKTLLISLYVGTNQVVLDNYAFDALRKHYAGEKIPVVFVFNDSNVVPISYFGANVSLEEISRAFNERHIKLADVPMWQLGDHHLKPTARELENLLDLPSLEDIDPLRREALGAELETYGFSRKPVFVTMLEGSSKMYVDDPERVRVAIAMGIARIPTMINFVEQDFVYRRCGPGTPTGSSGVSGSTTPPGGAVAPPGAMAPPTDPNPPASDS